MACMAPKWRWGRRSLNVARYSGPERRKMSASSIMADLPGPLEVCHKPIERIACDGIGVAGQMGVDGGGGRGIVAHILLEEAQVHSCFKQLGSIAVPAGVDRSPRMETTGGEGRPTGVLHTASRHGCGGRGQGYPPRPGAGTIHTGWRYVFQDWRSHSRVGCGSGTSRALAPVPPRPWTSRRALSMSGTCRWVPS